MYEVEWAKAFTKRHTNVYVVVHIQKLIPESRKSRVGVPDWHVAFFHLVCGVLFWSEGRSVKTACQKHIHS